MTFEPPLEMALATLGVAEYHPQLASMVARGPAHRPEVANATSKGSSQATSLPQ
jgi:hypothetical protein